MLISVKNLNFSYEKSILKDISLNIEKGQFISIIGPNGAGKSTLLKCMCGILHNYNGEIYIDNKDLNKYKRKNLAQKIAYIPQEQNINFDFTVEEIISMGFYSRLDSFYIKNELEELMKETDTDYLKGRSINSISGGEKQRVFLARALAQKSPILFLDEPISNLDIRHQHQIMNLCKNLSKEKNYTIISVLHDINLASMYSDKIAIIKNGTLVDFNIKDKILNKELLSKVYNFNMDIISYKNNIIILPEID